MERATQFSVALDGALLDRAERDVLRALIVQNSRFSQRFDPAGRFRTPEVERRLQKGGIALCWAAVFLSVVLVGLGWMIRGGVSAVAIGCTAASTTLLVVFNYLPELRQWGIEQLDRTLAHRAAARLAALREAAPLALRYVVERNTLRCEQPDGDNTRLRFERPLEDLRYALAGEACIALFRTERTQNPNVIVLVGEDTATSKWEVALRDAGLVVERLLPELVPKSTVERAW